MKEGGWRVNSCKIQHVTGSKMIRVGSQAREIVGTAVKYK